MATSLLARQENGGASDPRGRWSRSALRSKLSFHRNSGRKTGFHFPEMLSATMERVKAAGNRNASSRLTAGPRGVASASADLGIERLEDQPRIMAGVEHAVRVAPLAAEPGVHERV